MTLNNSTRNNFYSLRVLLVIASLLPVLGLLVTKAPVAHAEAFASSAFQNQWKVTDADVLSGKVARTYFWGPQPFAHTVEVYSESPSSTREVQYFDKGRMELTKKAGQDPNYVTNGLLTVELVSGQMQIGDNSFISHTPATIPVVGDPIKNDTAPTYASFNRGKLAYGVAGAITATDRTNQVVDQSLNKDGDVSKSAVLNQNVTYSQYIANTQHNIANVFYDFFQSGPLGSDKWLAVMGFPISEPYWVTATVAGKSQSVLVQLFERRALTYTPNNPSGWQVEMGNIGQHYYAWRYGVSQNNDELPGNYRVLYEQGESLYSTGINKANNFKVADLSTNTLYTLLTVKNGVAIIATGDRYNINQKLYVLDLTKFNSSPTLINFGSDVPYLQIKGVGLSADGKKLVAVVDSITGNPQPPSSGNINYDKTVIQEFSLAATKIVSSTRIFDGKFYPDHNSLNNNFGPTVGDYSPDGRYLPLVKPNLLILLDLATNTLEPVTFAQGEAFDNLKYSHWLPNGQLLAWLAPVFSPSFTETASEVGLLNPTNLNFNSLTSVLDYSEMSVSPDGNYLALLRTDSYTTTLLVRSLTNPNSDLATVIRTSGSAYSSQAFAAFGTWSPDSSYLNINYAIQVGGGGVNVSHFLQVIPTNGKILTDLEVYGLSDAPDYYDTALPYYLLHYYNRPNYYQPGGGYTDITTQNLDGSDKTTILHTINDTVVIIGFAQVPKVAGN